MATRSACIGGCGVTQQVGASIKQDKGELEIPR